MSHVEGQIPISAEIIQHKADIFWDIMYHCILGRQCLYLLMARFTNLNPRGPETY